MKKRIILFYLVGIHLFLVVVLLKSNFIERVESKLGLDADKPEITEFFHTMLAYHLRMDGNIPEKSVIFIGDSITQGLAVSAVASLSVNYGIGGDTTVGVLKRIQDYTSISKARTVVISIGINDMKYRKNDEIFANIKSIVEKIPQQIPLVFSAVLPIDEELKGSERRGWNATRIKELNSRIKTWIEPLNNRFFVDAGSSLIDENGNLSDEFHIGDGIHLNSMGNAIWIGLLQGSLEDIQRDVASGMASR